MVLWKRKFLFGVGLLDIDSLARIRAQTFVNVNS